MNTCTDPPVPTALRMTSFGFRSKLLSKKALEKTKSIVSRRRIGRLMEEENLQVQTRRKFKATTNSNHDKPVAPNLLEREFIVTTPDTFYVDDITCISTREGWLYLAIVIDLFSRAVAESFFHTLKIELIHHCDFKTRDEARGNIRRH